MLFGDGAKRDKFANAGVGENNVDSPLHLRDRLVKTIQVGEFGDVTLNTRNIAADCFHGLVEFLLAAAGDEDVGTFFHEKPCRSQPNSFCAAGDDSDLTFELLGHCLSPLLPSSELATSNPSHSISCVRASLGRGDRRDGSCGSVRRRSDCAKDLWRNLLPIRPSVSGSNRTTTFSQTPSAIQH